MNPPAGQDGSAAAYLRPRDAATLLVLERRGRETFVLMGRRHAAHAFMPGKFVFPGGRTDPHDGRVPTASELHPRESERLAAGGVTARGRAIALSALRETYEEAGLLVGTLGPFATRQPDWQGFVIHNVQPSLAPLRFVARAITPPGRVRRYDTRFLACWRAAVALELPTRPTGELEALAWLALGEAMEADVPAITRTILGELLERLRLDPQMLPGGPAPFYRMVRGHFVRELL